MYQELAVTNYFLFRYNMGIEEFEDFSELEIPN
jgi:hypothetical protein